jgi:hypothetical protein
MFRILFLCWFIPVLMFVAGTARAQTASNDQQSAYVALYYTPVAGLPPLAPSFDTSSHNSGSRVVLQGRYGQMNRGGELWLKTMGVGVEIPMGHWNLAGTMAYLAANCTPDWRDVHDCTGDIMLGATARRTFLNRPLGDSPAPVKGKRPARPPNDESFLVGFEGAVGFSPRQSEQALALSAGVPVALAFRNGDVRILPFITPGLGYGRLGHVIFEDEDAYTSHGSILPMLGGGLGLEFGKSGVGVNLGFQKVFKSYGGTTQLGLGMTWQGLTSVH